MSRRGETGIKPNRGIEAVSYDKKPPVSVPAVFYSVFQLSVLPYSLPLYSNQSTSVRAPSPWQYTPQ